MEKSPTHIELLSVFSKPHDVYHILTWQTIRTMLGETTEDAIDRFVRDSLLIPATLEESIAVVLQVVELKKLLEARDLRLSGSKRELVERLVKADLNWTEKLLRNHEVMKCSIAALTILDDRKYRQSQDLEVAQKLSYKSLKNGNPMDAYKSYVDYHKRYSNFPYKNGPYTIKELQFILNKNPKALGNINREDLRLLQAAAGMGSLWGDIKPELWLPEGFTIPSINNQRALDYFQSQSQSSESKFVDVSPVRSRKLYQPSVSVSISYESTGTIFLKESQEYRSRDGELATHIPFMHHWPTYRDMNASQQRWYFYWRSEARKGNYLPTDSSYIFLHIYEILNLVEIPDPIQAANRIKVLWQTYRGTYSQLDRYLPDWGGDLLAVKAGGRHAIGWWESFLDIDGLTIPDPVINTIVEKAIRIGGTNTLPYKIWALLSDYQPKKKFYQVHNINRRIDLAYEKAIQVANDYYLRASKKSLIDMFVSEHIYNYDKSVFASALIGYPYQRMTQLASGRNYVGSTRLANHITSIMKYAENILREQLKFSTKLSGVEIPVKLTKELDIAFLSVKPELEPIYITIDPARVAALHKESQEVSAMLATETENTEKTLLTGLAEMRTLWLGLNILERQIITGIFKGDLKTTVQVEQAIEPKEITMSNIIRVDKWQITVHFRRSLGLSI
ncbi:MAG: TerB N-terminal domain-containing protein [Nitrospira sp.]